MVAIIYILLLDTMLLRTPGYIFSSVQLQFECGRSQGDAGRAEEVAVIQHMQK